ncbi:MAG: hypothetical protein PHW82_06775 [Bacteroidales bacterium]|nr:hypothetical protein [Bacteroidales bacterium]
MMKKINLILYVLFIAFLTSCEKQYSIYGDHETDPNYPENSNSIEEVLNIHNYILTSEYVYVYDFAFDSKNTLWATTNFGLLKISEKNHELFQVPYSEGGSYPLSTITIDKNDYIWLTSIKNIYKFSSINNTWATYSYDDGVFFQTGYSRVFCDSEGKIYVADAHSVYEFKNENWQELIRFENVTGELLPYMGNPGSRDVITKKDDFLWVSTHRGLVKYKNDTCFEFLTTENSDIADNMVYAIHIDSKNRIWIDYETRLQVVENNIWTTHENKYKLRVCGDFIISDGSFNSDIVFYINNNWAELFKDYFFNIKTYSQARIDAENHLWFSRDNYLYKIKSEVLL